MMKRIAINPQKLGGTPVSAGTLVLIENLFDYLEADDGLEAVIEGFPPITPEQVIEVLKMV